MATSNTNGATASAKKTRVKKGEGPVTFKYVNDKNEVSKRIPDVLDGVQAIDKSGKVKNYSISNWPVQALRQMAAASFAVKVKQSVISSLKSNPSADIFTLVDAVYDNIKSGKIYVRAEGAKSPGRTFDFDLWVAAMVRMSQIIAEKNPKIKPFNKKQETDLRVRLEAMTPSDRKVTTTEWMTNPIVKRAIMEIKAERAKSTVSNEDYSNLPNLF